MVDLAKIRKKAKKGNAPGSAGDPESAGVSRSAGVPPAGPEASSPPRVPEPPPARGGEDAARPAAETAALRETAALPEASTLPASHKLDRFKAEAGLRRDVVVAQTIEQKLQLELLTFLIAGEQYAIDIEKIVEIVTPRPVTRIPNAHPSVVGIISLRGTIVTLVDVRRQLRHPAASAETENTRIVVIDLHKETVGFVVDRVLRVVKIAPSEVEPHPVVHTTELEEAIRGVFRVAGALTILLDLDKLLDHSQWT